ERQERRDHERPRRIGAEWKREQLDEPEMNGRLVRERRALERRQQPRSGGALLAYHLAVLRLVADEQIALRGSQQRRREDHPDQEQKEAIARHGRHSKPLLLNSYGTSAALISEC